jgi:hypothetical protein
MWWLGLLRKNGIYSVHSAYRMLKDEQAAKSMDATGEARASREDRVWSLVWKMNVPPKVRVFWWRVLHNFLPSKNGAEAETYCATATCVVIRKRI